MSEIVMLSDKYRFQRIERHTVPASILDPLIDERAIFCKGSQRSIERLVRKTSYFSCGWHLLRGIHGQRGRIIWAYPFAYESAFEKTGKVTGCDWKPDRKRNRIIIRDLSFSREDLLKMLEELSGRKAAGPVV